MGTVREICALVEFSPKRENLMGTTFKHESVGELMMDGRHWHCLMLLSNHQDIATRDNLLFLVSLEILVYQCH